MSLGGRGRGMTGFQKRIHDRHTLSLYMEVFEEENNHTPLFKCRTNNIGIGGLMIFNQGLTILNGSNLNVLLKATCRSGLREFPVEAKVVWETPEAIGMQFSTLDETEQKHFKRFLFESKVAVHSSERRRWRENSALTTTALPSSSNEALEKRN